MPPRRLSADRSRAERVVARAHRVCDYNLRSFGRTSCRHGQTH